MKVVVVTPPAKAFVVLVVLTSYLDLWDDDPQFEVMELYAGAARITRLAKALGLSTCGHDISFDRSQKSAFDLLDNAGFVFHWYLFREIVVYFKLNAILRLCYLGRFTPQNWNVFPQVGMPSKVGDLLYIELQVFFPDPDDGHSLQFVRPNKFGYVWKRLADPRGCYSLSFRFQLKPARCQVLAEKVHLG